MAFVFKAITPQLADITQIRDKILNALRAEGRLERNEYKKTVATWKEHTVEFDFKIGAERGSSGGTMSVWTGPVAGDIQIWKWLNNGTGVRHAIMSKGFVAKTTPGKFTSGSGSGHMVAVRKWYNGTPIEPRGWTDILALQRRGPFADAIMEAVRQGLAQWTRESNASGR
jgi:hypothetical protein